MNARAQRRRPCRRLLWRQGGAIWAVTLLVACGGGSTDCPGGAVVRPVGTPLSVERSAAVMESWPIDQAGLSQINTNEYRFDGDIAVLGPERVLVRVADTFTAQGCDESNQGVDALMEARFGATFWVDAQTGELMKAACNGCR